MKSPAPFTVVCWSLAAMMFAAAFVSWRLDGFAISHSAEWRTIPFVRVESRHSPQEFVKRRPPRRNNLRNPASILRDTETQGELILLASLALCAVCIGYSAFAGKS